MAENWTQAEVSKIDFRKLLTFIWTGERYWHEWVLTRKMKTMCRYPRLWVKSLQWMLEKTRDRGLPRVQGRSHQGSGQMFLWSILGCQAGFFTVTWTLESSLCKKGVFKKSTRVPNYTSDFYPRIVIKNIFKDLIICIFSFRVNPLKGSLIPCSTVLTKCFHIFFQFDSLFHFWKMLCNYFLM